MAVNDNVEKFEKYFGKVDAKTAGGGSSPEADLTEQNLPSEMGNIQAGLERLLSANLSPEQRTRVFNNLRQIGNGLGGVIIGSDVSKSHVENVMCALDAASVLTVFGAQYEEDSISRTQKAQGVVNRLNERYGVTPAKGK